jgi:hypothetical protein
MGKAIHPISKTSKGIVKLTVDDKKGILNVG